MLPRTWFDGLSMYMCCNSCLLTVTITLSKSLFRLGPQLLCALISGSVELFTNIWRRSSTSEQIVKVYLRYFYTATLVNVRFRAIMVVEIKRFVVVKLRSRTNIYLVDPASSHMLVSKIKPCMSKYGSSTVKLRMAH